MRWLPSNFELFASSFFAILKDIKSESSFPKFNKYPRLTFGFSVNTVFLVQMSQSAVFVKSVKALWFHIICPFTWDLTSTLADRREIQIIRLIFI